MEFCINSIAFGLGVLQTKLQIRRDFIQIQGVRFKRMSKAAKENGNNTLRS